MFNLDTFRLIKKTFSRFLSLVMIVMIGVAFMMGLMSNATVLRESVDTYNDKNRLHDIQLYSSYGFCDEDIDEISVQKGINEVFASKMVDCYLLRKDGKNAVARVEESSRQIDRYEIIEGREPVAKNEAVVLTNSDSNRGYRIGDKIHFYLNDDDLEDNLSVTDYEVVGLAKSPSYMSKTLGTSNLNNEDLDIVVYVPNENFVSDYYTTVYLTLDGSLEKMSYTSSYMNLIDSQVDSIKAFSGNQENYLKDKLIREAEEEIADGEKELEEKRADGQKELDDARIELNDGLQKLVDGQSEIDEAKETIEESKDKLSESEELLDENTAKINEAIALVEKSGSSVEELSETLLSTRVIYHALKESNSLKQIDQTIAENLSKLQQESDPKARDVLEKQNVMLSEQKTVIQTYLYQMDKTVSEASGNSQDTVESFYTQWEILYQSEKMMQINPELVDETTKLMILGIENQYGPDYIQETFNAAFANCTIYQALKGDLTLKELNQNAEQLSLLLSNPSLNEEERNTYIGMLQGVQAKIVVLNTTLTTIENSIKESMNNDSATVDSAYADIMTLISAKQQLSEAREQIKDGWKQIAEAEEKLAEAEEELADGWKEYFDGLEEYNDGLKEYNEKIADAEADIRKAKQDLEDLPDAEWMVLDRDSHYTSYMYKNTISQMTAIGYSLPLLFFLVAALVCMTTMTRLVDEQRGQIGIFRALGFSKAAIIGKYVIYALAASLIGSFFGLFIGQAIFPTVIYTCWRLMYDLPEMQICFPIQYVLICVCSFSLLMMGVTYFVVRESLKEVPSQLMRPKAPKNAKPVFLEKIKPLWNSLSFTSKITARNLIRYKSRFLMTVIGVAGCTGLLVVGFGIKDSISDIIDLQYSRIFGYKYQVNFENDDNLKENIYLLNNQADCDTIVSFGSYTTKLYKDNQENTANVQVMNAEESGKILGLRKTDGRTSIFLDDHGVIVSKKFAENNHISAGDYITIESKEGIKAEVYVKEICEMYFQHYIFISDNYYNQVFNENVRHNHLALNTNDLSALKNVCAEMEGFKSITDFSGMIKQFQTMIKALDLIVAVIVLTSGSLAFVVLINLTQVNISERIREIATLKVLGFRNGEVNSYIFKEIFMLSLIGAIVGLPLGVIEHHFIMNVIDMEMVTFGMNISVLSFTYSFLITVVFTVIVLAFMRKPLRDIEMVESLKSVE